MNILNIECFVTLLLLLLLLLPLVPLLQVLQVAFLRFVFAPVVRRREDRESSSSCRPSQRGLHVADLQRREWRDRRRLLRVVGEEAVAAVAEGVANGNDVRKDG